MHPVGRSVSVTWPTLIPSTAVRVMFCAAGVCGGRGVATGFGALLFVVGSLLDILDGALARTSGKGTPFGAFLDSTLDRLSDAALAIAALAADGKMTGKDVARAIKLYKIDSEKPNPVGV